MELLVNVNNQKLRLATNLKSLVAGSQQFIKFTFNLSDEWDDLLTFAQFIQGSNSYNAYLDEDNSVYLPHEIQAGTCKLILYGTGSQGEGSQIIATTNYLELNIDENITVANASSTDISQSLYDQLVNKFNKIADLSQTEYVEEIKKQVNAIAQEYIDSDDWVAENISDGSLARTKVNDAFEATLDKADNSWQRGENAASGTWDDTYDTNRRKTDIFNYVDGEINSTKNYVDGQIGSITNRQATGSLDLVTQEVNDAKIFRYDYTPQYQTNITGQKNYTTLKDAVQGIYAEALGNAKDYADAKVRESINILIVDELPLTGQVRTFYLVPKESGNGYDKWWYVTNEYGVSFWDTFGSTSTVIVSSLNDVDSPSEDIDYIVRTDSGYLYYKYIDNNWEMIAGSSAEVIFPSYTINYKDYGLPTANDYVASEHNGKRYLNLTDFKVYLSDGTDWNLVETLAIASELTDYYLNDGSGTYVHYRYINNRYEAIGVSSTEMEALVSNTVTPIANRLSTAEGNISTMQTTLNNLSNMVKDVTISNNVLTITYNDDSTTTLTISTGIKIGAVRYNEREDNYMRFYDNNDTELEDLACYIPSGGGGSSTTSGTAYITRVTDSSVQTIYGDNCNISYKFTAVDSSNELVGNGVGTLYINNVAVETGFDVYNGLIDGSIVNTIDVSKYLVVGSNTVKISISVNTGGETNTVTTKTWSVNAINMYLDWKYTDSQINTSAVTDYYTPFGALPKTIYTFIDVEPVGFNPIIVDELPSTSDEDFDATGNYFVYDGTNYTHYVWDNTNNEFINGTGTMLDVTTTTRSGVQQALTIPMQSHGSHTIVRYMVGDVNNIQIKTTPQVHDMIFVTNSGSTPIIATSFNIATMVQYNTVQIPIVIYAPSNATPTVYLYEDGDLVSTWSNVDRTLHYWNYSPTTYGTKTLAITCGTATKTIVINVEQLIISESEVTGYDFRFKASEIATNSSAQNWSATTVAGQPVTVTYSDNFDWINGGLHTEEDESGRIRQYFAVRAGTTMTINYNLFGQNYDPKQYGKNFKFIFKAVNCRTYDAQVLKCMDESNGNNGVGLVMTANNAVMTTVGETLDTHYCKDTYIEFEANIHPDSEYRYLQFWMDGSHDRTILYSADDTMQQVSPVGITIGSPNCDVYIYMIKAYPVYMTNENELSNFIMDAPNAFEMVSRYDRNDILNSSGEIDYQKLANKNPDLHVLLLDLNRMSTGKKDNALAYSFRHIYNKGGTSECFTVNNACVTIQGTSSVGYLESAGNMDVNFKNNRTFQSDSTDYTTSAILFDDGTTSTNGYSISENAIPVDYLNIKVNVASSENCNNACIADWYNTYQPWLSPVRKKNSKSRDTIEFVPAVVFIRDRNPDMNNSDSTKRNLFGDTQNYHLYGICDIGNSKKNTKVFHDTTNPLACCVEVANNTSLPCLMSSKTYTWNSKNEAVITENGEEQKVFEFRYEGDMVNKAKSAWDRFVEFMYDHNPNLATNNSLGTSVTFAPYTFKGSGTYDTSSYDSDSYDVVYLYGYGLPNVFNNGMYATSDYVTDTTANATCYYYINYSNNQIYSSNGTTWTSIGTLTWTRDNNSVLGGTTISTYAGTYTTDSFNYRMAYLLEHCEEYMVIDPVIYHFIFIESFLMTDNVAKNTFWSSDDLVHWELSKDYDNDTALGNDNVGGLSFTYGLETDDTVGSSYVFNAHDAAWITFARGLFDACATMYRNCESAGCFNTTNFLAKTRAWQDTRPERVWVADTQRKYLRPYEDNGTETYIDMLAGKKTHQREQVKTYNAYYYASKYVSDYCTAQNIMVRGNTPTTWQGVAPSNTATLSMYINCYIVVASTSYNVVAKVRANRGTQYVMDFSTIGSMGETELYFCTAPMITELSGLAHLYFKQNNFSMATNLQRLEIGSNVSGYSNPNLESLTIGTNKMLEYLDVRNCPNVTGSLDLSGCVSLKELYLENTAFTGVSFANGGLLEKAHLPALTMLSLRKLICLSDLTITSVNSLVQLIAENCGFSNSATLTIGSTSTTQAVKDIILNIIESSTNLSRIRIIGLDWSLASTNILNTLLTMAGIGDDGYSMPQSVLTGNVYVSGSIRNSELANYENAWSNLEVTYNSANLITQYLATYVNPDGTVLYSTYVDQGTLPPDPVTLGYISTPTQTATAQYTFTYSGWDDITSTMLGARTITAQYTQTVRTYTVTWYAREGLSLGSTQANYGAEVVYDGDLPTDISGEAQYIYKVFTGWDKSTGYITEDTDVYAVWETASTLPSTSKDLSNMTCAEIYGVCQAGKASDYFSPKDHFDITLGSDFNFSNVQSEVLLENRFFDGTQYIDTNIKLFDENAPSFTLAVDYEFLGSTVNNGCLVSSCVNNDGEGFKLQYNTNPCIKWGNKTITVGTSVNRNIVALRHIKGSNTMFVYTYNKGDTVYDLAITRTESVRSSKTETSQVLTFGGIRNVDGTEHGFYGKGWIYWAKIWYDDLGDNVARKLSSWIRETLRMEYIGENRYLLPNSMSNFANASFLANNTLPLLGRMNSTNDNTGGWAESGMRTFLNTRIYEALPYKWQCVIKQVSVKSSAGGTSYSITTSNDKLYLAANREVGGSTNSPYVDEVDVTTTIGYFTNNRKRLKFCGVIIRDDAQYIVESTEPTLLTSYTVSEGDIWVNTNNQNIGYIYMSADTIAKHTHIGCRAISSTDNIQANDGGCWICASGWWERSPSASNSVHFMLIDRSGTPGNDYGSGASSSYGVAVGFSI